MRILDLHISGFGKLRNRDFTFESGLNVVYGHNEAGKSTLHTFIRGMLSASKSSGAAPQKMIFTTSMNPGPEAAPMRDGCGWKARAKFSA